MFGKETPASISAWNEETFNTTVDQIANRAFLEIAELYYAVLSGDTTEAFIEELADVAIMLWAVASGNNIKVEFKPDHFLTTVNYKHFSNEIKEQLTIEYCRLLCIDYATYLHEIKELNNKINIKLIESINHLNTIAHLWNIHLPDIVDNKMAINRSRNWKKVGKDNFQHV